MNHMTMQYHVIIGHMTPLHIQLLYTLVTRTCIHVHYIHVPSDSLTLSCFCSLVVVDTLREVEGGEGREDVMVEEGEW